ncbi:hypothetical protein K474DRAFT_1672453 [Panus rudis PR-1116 ss-1]|nr:hypothetical protein K474DRAFT_1672453 [Panus rudis PR-1116 ss-1]
MLANPTFAPSMICHRGALHLNAGYTLRRREAFYSCSVARSRGPRCRVPTSESAYSQHWRLQQRMEIAILIPRFDATTAKRAKHKHMLETGYMFDAKSKLPVNGLRVRSIIVDYIGGPWLHPLYKLHGRWASGRPNLQCLRSPFLRDSVTAAQAKGSAPKDVAATRSYRILKEDSLTVLIEPARVPRQSEAYVLGITTKSCQDLVGKTLASFTLFSDATRRIRSSSMTRFPPDTTILPAGSPQTVGPLSTINQKTSMQYSAQTAHARAPQSIIEEDTDSDYEVYLFWPSSHPTMLFPDRDDFEEFPGHVPETYLEGEWYPTRYYDPPFSADTHSVAYEPVFLESDAAQQETGRHNVVDDGIVSIMARGIRKLLRLCGFRLDGL